MSWTITKWVKKRNQGVKYETFIWVVATFALRQIKVKRRQRWHSCGLNRPRHAPISYAMNFLTFMGTNFLIKAKNMYDTMAIFPLTHCSPPLGLLATVSTSGPCLSLSLSVSGSRHKQNLLLLLLKVAASPSDRPNIVWASKSRQSSGIQTTLSALKTRPADLTSIEYNRDSCLKFSRKRFTKEVASKHSSHWHSFNFYCCHDFGSMLCNFKPRGLLERTLGSKHSMYKTTTEFTKDDLS